MILIYAGVCVLLGAQLIWLQSIWLGGTLILVGFYKGWHVKWHWLLVPLIVGLVSGWHEQQLTQHPPEPVGAIRVQATAWKVANGFASYTGTAANGVVVAGGGNVSAAVATKLAHVTSPVMIDQPGDFETIETPRNLYEFNYRDYAWAQYHQAFRATTAHLTIRPVPTSGIIDRLYALRRQLLARMNQLPEHVATYAKALLLGVMDDDDDLRTVFSRLGIIHLFSVSGLHIFAIVGMLYTLTNRLRIPREWTDAILLLILPALLVVIPPGAGIVRAVWMRLLQVVGARIHMPLTTLDGLCLTLAGNLLVQPRVLWTLGGQMTYLLTFVLIAGENVGTLRQSFTMACVSMPPLLHAVFGMHLLTFVFNWLLMPLFEVVMMPALMVACAWPQNPLVFGLDRLIAWGERGLSWLANCPGYLTFGALPYGLTLLLTVLVVRAVAINRYALVVAALIVSYAVVNVHPAWRVTVIDVGQGDSILIEAPFKQATVLIDTGGRGFGQSSNPPAKKATLNYLAARGITRLDALVLTHPDADHVGDASVITKGIHVREIVTTPISAQADLIQQAQAAGKTGMHLVMAGNQLRYGPLKLKVVAPNVTHTEDTNPNSVVLYGTIGDSKWLFTGDADQSVEETQLLPQQLQVDFLKVGHHGSKTASAPAFINQIHPKVGFISAGVANRYGHPNQETLATFAKAGIPLLMTNKSGMLWVDATQKTHQLHTFLGIQ